jgi:hypothetical protein
MDHTIGKIPGRAFEGAGLPVSSMFKQENSTSLKMSGLVNLFVPPKEENSSFSHRLGAEGSKIGFVVQALVQMRRENSASLKAPEGATAYLVELFEAENQKKESEEDLGTLLEESELLACEEAREEIEKETPEQSLEEAFEDELKQLFDAPETAFEEGEGKVPEEDLLGELLLKEMWEQEKKLISSLWQTNQKSYASLLEGFVSFLQLCKPLEVPSLIVEVDRRFHSGLHPTMKEASFLEEMEEGILLGLFGGSKLALTYVRQTFRDKFPKEGGARGFQNFVARIQEEILQNELWTLQGSLAILCFIERKTGRIYTAGWGGGEVYLSRRGAEKQKLIPLLCPEKSKTSITVNKLKAGDRLLILSKGCDYCFSEEEILLQIEQVKLKESLSLALLNEAVYAKQARENISLIDLKIFSI